MAARRRIALASMCASWAFLALSTATARSGSPAGLGDVRVCGAESFDRGAVRCRSDESGKPIVASHVFCSASVWKRAGQRFDGNFSYRGEALPSRGKAVPDNGSRLWIDVTVGTPLPGGDWGCRLSVGLQTVTKSFRSGGPTGPIVGVGVCPTTHTVVAGPVRVCSRDESATPFARIPSVTCSAVFPGAKGEVGRVDLVYQGKETGVSIARRLPLAVTAFGAHFSRAGPLPAGSYACRYVLAGKQVALERFAITG